MAPPDVNSITTDARPRAASHNLNGQNTSTPSASRRPAPLRSGSGSFATARRPSAQLSSTSEQFPAMPQRHEQPMTPAQLHMEMEREQEALVNRLTQRLELESVRTHSSSVGSSQSESSNPHIPVAQPPTPSLTAPTNPFGVASSLLTSAPSFSQPIATPRHPTESRHHRSSSSSLSSRTQSLTSSSPAFSVQPSLANSVPGPAPQGHSQASVDRARDAAGIQSTSQYHGIAVAPSRSRRGSMRSAQPSPAPSASFGERPSSRISSRQSVQLTSSRVEEAIAARKTLDENKAENDELAKRVRELELELRSIKGGDERRGRPTARDGSESAGAS